MAETPASQLVKDRTRSGLLSTAPRAAAPCAVARSSACTRLAARPSQQGARALPAARRRRDQQRHPTPRLRGDQCTPVRHGLCVMPPNRGGGETNTTRWVYRVPMKRADCRAHSSRSSRVVRFTRRTVASSLSSRSEFMRITHETHYSETPCIFLKISVALLAACGRICRPHPVIPPLSPPCFS